MKIAIVCEVLGKGNNGTAVVTKNLYEHLKKNGHDVKIICADQSKKGEDGYFVLPTVRLGKVLDAYVDSVGVTLAKCDKKIMARALNGVEYVHCIMPFALGRYAVRYAKSHNIPVTAGFHLQAENITAHLKLNKFAFLQKLIYKRLYKRFFGRVDAIHYPTQFIKDVFENAVGKKTNGYVISNGVHEYVRFQPAFKPEQMCDKIVIGNIGRYSREKSQDTLIKAVNYSKYRNNIQLILAGQGAREKYFKRLSKRLPVPPVFGAMPREEIVNMINYSDLYVHTAEIELEGIACLEAIKCGVHTIVSDSRLSATKGFVSDVRCVYKNGRPEELAKTIDYWIEHRFEKENCRRLVSDSEMVKYVGECMREFEKMIEEVIKKSVKAENSRSAVSASSIDLNRIVFDN